jgi:NADH-quinone oxidoreductase subunit N
MVLLGGASLLVLVLDVLQPGRSKDRLALVSLAGVILALFVTGMLWGKPGSGFREMVVLDDFALFFNLVFLVSTGLVLLISAEYIKRRGVEYGEYYVLVLFAALGMMLMASGSDLIVIFLGLELMSLSLYVLAGFFRTQLRSSESSLKYFLLGAFATGFFLYGIALIYGATGSTNLAKIAAALKASGGRPPLVLIGLGLLLVGFGFKLSSVPFHMWVPDVYEGAPTAVTAFIATGSKAAAFAALIRVLWAGLGPLQADWTGLLWVIAFATMTVGNVVAIAQSNIKRMLAYSSIAHVGYMLVALVAGSGLGLASVLFYLLVYAFTQIGAFAIVLVLEKGGQDAEEMADYGGLGNRHRILALAMVLFLLSFIGIPPTAGFVGKFYIFSAAIKAGYVWLAVVGVLNSVLSSYYYLRVVVYMYMREPEADAPVSAGSVGVNLALALSCWGVLQLGLYPGPFFALAQRAIQSFLP